MQRAILQQVEEQGLALHAWLMVHSPSSGHLHEHTAADPSSCSHFPAESQPLPPLITLVQPQWFCGPGLCCHPSGHSPLCRSGPPAPLINTTCGSMPRAAPLHSNAVLLIPSPLLFPTSPETSPFCQAPVSHSPEPAALGGILLHFPCRKKFYPFIAPMNCLSRAVFFLVPHL